MAVAEVMTPSSRYTAFPGGVYALRPSDYMGPARGSLTTASDPTSPNGEYVSDVQVVAASPSTNFNTYTGTANGAALASDTLVIDLTEFGLNSQLTYAVMVLYRIIGTNPVAANYWERYSWRYSAQVCASVNGTYVITATRVPVANNYDKWGYTYYDDFENKFTLGGDNTLRIRAFAMIASGLEVRIGQVVLIPNSQSTGTTWSDNDFMQSNGLIIRGTRPALISGDDVRSDDLGSITVEFGRTIPGNFNAVREYQTLTDPNDAEWLVKSLDMTPSNSSPSTHSYILWGTHATEAQDVENITFNSVIPWVGYTRNGTYSPPGANWYDATTSFGLMLGTTSYGRRIEIKPKMWGQSGVVQGHVFWGYGGYFSPFTVAPAKVEMDGTSIVMSMGGHDNNVTGVEINIGDDSQRVLSGDATAPFLPDMWDYEIESTVSWDRNLTNASDVAEIGRHGSQHFMNLGQGYDKTYWQMGNSLVIKQHADGSLWGRIRRKLKTGEFQTAVESSTTEIMFDSGYSPGTKIRMKFRRMGYVLQGKIWYDGSTEPSTWDYSDYVVGQYVISASPFNQAAVYPYNTYHRDTTTFTPPYMQYDGFDRAQDSSFDFVADGQGAFFCRSEVPPGSINTFGPETVLTTFKWYNYRLSQPDPGDTTAVPHLMIKKTSDSSVYIPDITGTPDRQMLHYLTSTPMTDAKIYAWTEAGSGILNAVSLGQFFAMNIHDDFQDLSFHRLFSPPGAYA